MPDFGANKGRAVQDFFNREAHFFGKETAEQSTNKALNQAKFGYGPLAGKTGNRLVDDRPTLKSQQKPQRGAGIKSFDPFANW